jgi:Pyruvate/2-oxoacid:ferredoxin oxidoreductase delta subunit/predicted membrane protein
MKAIKIIGLVLFVGALVVFTMSMFNSKHQLTESLLTEHIYDAEIQKAVISAAANSGTYDKTYGSNFAFVSGMKDLFDQADAAMGGGKIQGWQREKYLFPLTKNSTDGPFSGNTNMAFWLSILLGALGAMIFILPDLALAPGIKNNGIYHNAATKGISLPVRLLFLGGALLYALWYSIGQFPLVIFFVLVVAYIVYTIWKSEKDHASERARKASVNFSGWLGIAIGVYLISFYVLLYFFPYYVTNWVKMVDPIAQSLSGGEASQWFLYGFLYCIVMVVMGIRMMIKYRHNKYQLVRTCSVLFFQLGFAFLLPEIMVKLNQPYMDLKNAWPLNYGLFTGDSIDKLAGQGSELALGGMSTNVGTIMLIWGVILTLVVVPVFTYFYGKRWYCSWVCGCGGLAETLGDPFRQLSDKSVRAWKVERYVIHGVLAFAVVMTGLVLVHYFTGIDNFYIFKANSVKSWYGFMIGAMFSGVVGTGFYPLMGNRVWCRFGCPLAGILGLVQKFKSRFRITTNGGQCISCGNCSTYCEMGIDVRAYAQKGQNIVRASCVGCGVCAAVCPRGVLKLENGSDDIGSRTTELKAIHISESDLKILS